MVKLTKKTFGKIGVLVNFITKEWKLLLCVNMSVKRNFLRIENHFYRKIQPYIFFKTTNCLNCNHHSRMEPLVKKVFKPPKQSRFYSFSLQTNKFVKTLLRNAFLPHLTAKTVNFRKVWVSSIAVAALARRPFFSRYGRPPVNKHSHRHNMYQMHHCHHSV